MKALVWFLVMLIFGGVLAVWLYVHRNPEWPKPLDDFEITEAWLECFDCQEGFFNRLSGMSAGHKDSITRLLSAALFNGPDSAHSARFERGLRRTWVADSLYLVNQGDTSTYDFGSYLTRYRRGYEITWRRRAAIALGVIRTDSALAALDLALKQLPQVTFVDSVLYRTIEQARGDSAILVP